MAKWKAVAVIFVLSVFATLALGSFGFGDGNDKVLLRDINVLTLKHGQMTSSRRSSPIPQLKCLGGSAVGKFVPQVVQCYNRGSDGYDVQWECKADMDNEYRFGQVEVSCEGYEYPDDPYVLRGSCGLEYTLEYTKEGYQKRDRASQYSQYNDHDTHHNSHDSNTYDSGSSYNYKKQKGNSWLGDLLMLAIVGVIIYGIYKTCIANSHDAGQRPGDDGRQQPRGGRYSGASAPPPPGFRSDYTQGCGSTYDDYSQTGTQHTGHTPHQTTGTGGGGFWSGAATGGILGYLFGSRTNTQYNGYGQPNNGWGSRSRGWGTGWGSGWGSGWGPSNRGWGSSSGFSSWGSSRSSGGSAFSSGSSGTRTASGFGGTKRR